MPDSLGHRPLRGEVWRVNLRTRQGREQRGVRPCLVVSTDALNRSNFGTVVVCPLTTRERRSFRWRVRLAPEDLEAVHPSWEATTSWVQTDQIVTIDTGTRVLERLARVAEPARMEEVDASLRLMLGL